MTRLRLEDLPPKMRQQAIKQIAEQEKAKLDLLKPVSDTLTTAANQTDGNKYKAKKTTVVLPDGTEHTFDSAKEARIYNELLVRLKAKEIQNLSLQKEYVLLPKQIKSNGKAERGIKYIADFYYEEGGKPRVIDVKGYRKGQAYAVFVIKRKLMLWIHHIEVEEV